MCINKPAGLRSQPDRTGDECARSSVGAALGHLPWVTHRLDRRVTGCLLLARTQRAASRLGRFFSERRVTKHYLAVCELPASDGVVPGGYARLRSASGEALDYRVLDARDGMALLDVSPAGGRRHQIRRLLAEDGAMPIAGDFRYGARRLPRVHNQVLALHAATLQLPHPVAGHAPLAIAAPLPAEWATAPIPATLAERAAAELAVPPCGGDGVLWDPAPDFDEVL